jgi:hypothetical protein
MRKWGRLAIACVVLAGGGGTAAAAIPDTVWLDDYENCPALQALCPDADGDDYGDAPWCFNACQQPYDFFPIPPTDCNDDNGAINPGAAEVCNGIDDDCDHAVDLADGDYQAPANLCLTQGECAGTTPTCTGAGGNKCFYADPDVELLPDGSVAPTETRCDDKDNNCDGGIDESFTLKGTPCDTGLPGICAPGVRVCNVQQNGLRCAQTVAAKTEKCGDGLDNDCDGMIDEPGCVP